MTKMTKRNRVKKMGVLCNQSDDKKGPGTYVQKGSIVIIKFITPEMTHPKPISIHDKTVTIDLIVDDNDKDKTTTVGAIIELLELIDDNSFNDVINCNIPASSKLSTINCTINTQVKTGVSYRLDGTPFITSDGGDDFGLVTLDKYTQISVDNVKNVKNDSFGLKVTCLIYLFLLFL